MDRVRIGNGCGFWGDNLDAPVLLARQAALDYLTLEYLAELTMSILARLKQKDPQAGYATDFLDVLEQLVPILQTQPGLKILTNAGGMNPLSCAQRAQDILQRASLPQRIAVVTGDDLMPHLDRLLEQGLPFTNLETGQPLSTVRDRVVSANAYLGARPIVAALEQGASLVITGRVADASLTLAPCVHELGWRWDEWDHLAGGTVAGHLIECGAQATGGLWCNWTEAPDLANVGYPFVEVERSGDFVLSKPAGTGGAVNRETATEQLLYEIGDPAAYLTPDVVVDFTSLAVSDEGADRVRVRSAHGTPATDSYKVSIAYRDGYLASGMLVIVGPDAAAKAQRCGEIILERVARAGIALQQTMIECLGAGAVFPPGPAADKPSEVVLRVTARDSRRAALERFSKEFAPLVTAGPPGVTGYATGRPPVREIFAYWPALIPKSAVSPTVRLLS